MEWKLIIGKLLRRKRVTAHVLLRDGDKFLLVQEAVGRIRELWGLPGGGVEEGEVYERTAEREAEEETGYDIKIIKKLIVIEDKKRGSIRHVFLAKIKSGELKIREDEHMDARWFTVSEIENMKGKLRGDWVLRAVKSV